MTMHSAEKVGFVLRPFGFAQDRQAQHERKLFNGFGSFFVRPEPVEG
jgi:hypothetical protein